MKERRGATPRAGARTNRLAVERSPYLRRHADNPVDWYPWGEEAFERAKEEDKPIFLSIGYSTCHWCHVMERECFEDTTVAGMLNNWFVCVKVDREERPDIDDVYMAVCQGLTGGGGWPLTIIMTPEKKPFFAATYIPKESRYGRVGLTELLPRVAELWRSNRGEVVRSAEEIAAAVSRAFGRTQAGELSGDLLKDAYERLASEYDPRHGGFGEAPKFPTPHNLTFLLRYWRRTGEGNALDMALGTLEEMRRGGIYDHLGFGFHRYSTDAEWLLPHFEKMLYDQALLAVAYTDAYAATKRPVFGKTAREILQYLLRDMRAPEGGFYSAEDADSEGEEGRFYLWTRSEMREILGEEDGDLFADAYGIASESGEGAPQGKVLHLAGPFSSLAAERSRGEAAVRERIERARERLFEARSARVRPARDEKILTDWNGLAIAALARAGRTLGERRFVGAASDAASFLLASSRDESGGLLHSYFGGKAEVPAFLDDYAFLVWGLVELYQASFQERWLEQAFSLTDRMVELFWDGERGGFYSTRAGSDLVARPREGYDGAVPSGNSIAAWDLLLLSRISGRPDLEKKAQETLRAFSGDMSRAPEAFTRMLGALDFALGPSYEIVLVGDPAEIAQDPMTLALRSEYLPNAVVLFRPSNAEAPPITTLAEFTLHQRSLNGETTAYVCTGRACKEPTTDVGRMLELLGL